MALSRRGAAKQRSRTIVAVAICFVGATTTAHARVTISTDPTFQMTCSAGICSPTAKDAVLNVGDLANMLASSDVTVTTGNGAVGIAVEASLTWTSTNRLTLDAMNSVFFDAPVVVAGSGGLSVLTNDGGSGGDLIFSQQGWVDFWDLGSSLVINGKSYLLVSSLPTLAAAVKSNQSGAFALAKSVDAAGDGTYTSPPVATLKGAFEGLGHTISNFSIVSYARDVGLFGTLKKNAVVRDIILGNGSVKTKRLGRAGFVAGTNQGLVHRSYAAGVMQGELAGMLVGENQGTVSDCSGSGSATAGETGGLIGTNSGTVADSSADAAVSGFNYAGGLVAYNTGTIERSHATGAVTLRDGSDGAVGGLVGNNYDGKIDRSFATGAVESSGMNVFGSGGLAGMSSGTISQSFASGDVTSDSGAGGLVGEASGTIEQSYATGAVSSISIAGGLVYSSYRMTIDQSYSTGYVSQDAAHGRGGLIGDDFESGSIVSAYWDLDTSGVSDPSQGAGNIANDPGITGLTDKELKSALPSGFDPKVWKLKHGINGGYPYLRNVPPPN
jgi:hypothetical protein